MQQAMQLSLLTGVVQEPRFVGSGSPNSANTKNSGPGATLIINYPDKNEDRIKTIEENALGIANLLSKNENAINIVAERITKNENDLQGVKEQAATNEFLNDIPLSFSSLISKVKTLEEKINQTDYYFKYEATR